MRNISGSIFKTVSKRTLIVILFVGLLIAVGVIGVLAAVRSSTSYSITLDSTSCGGGASNSASYQEPDSAVGQESACGPATSASYIENAGIVQSWGGKVSWDATGWIAY